MEKRSRLGRGLSSLMSVNDATEPAASVVAPIDIPAPAPASGSELRDIAIEQISPNPQQPRRRFEDSALHSLAQSMKIAGIIQPILVRQVSGGYQLVAGERRWRAAKLAGLVVVPAIVRPIEPLEQAQLALMENIHREDLNPIDRALAYQAMLNALGYTHQELADKLGEERSSIANHLRLIALEPAVRDMVSSGSISFGHAKLLASVDDPNNQLKLANLVVSQQLSVRNLEKLLKNAPPDTAPPAPGNPPSAHIADLERQISRDLQMRTEVRQGRKGGKGRIVIHYASLDQFDQLLQRLQVKIDD